MQPIFSSLMMMLPFFMGACADDMPLRAEFDLGPVKVVEKPIERNRIEVDAEPVVPAQNAGVSTTEAIDSRIELNSATLQELVTLPGVGPAMAAKIDAYRKKRPFKRLRDLRRVRGIGPATFKKLKPLVRIDDL